MSLQITTTITTIEGIEVSDAYGRVAVTDSYDGTQLQAQVRLFPTEAAFLDGKQAMNTSLNVFSFTVYDRNVQGTDILALGHQDLQLLLASQGVESTINL